MKSEISAQEICKQVWEYIEKEKIAEIGPEQQRLQFKSLIVLFPHEQIKSEEEAAEKLFSLLTAMHRYDKVHGKPQAQGVSTDPRDKKFSYSIGGEAFFVPFLYEHSFAPARRAPLPLLVFNSHRMFNELKRRGKFQAVKQVIRDSQLKQFGFIPDLLADYGEDLEFLQYLLPSGDNVEMAWTVLNAIAGTNPFD